MEQAICKTEQAVRGGAAEPEGPAWGTAWGRGAQAGSHLEVGGPALWFLIGEHERYPQITWGTSTWRSISRSDKVSERGKDEPDSAPTQTRASTLPCVTASV